MSRVLRKISALNSMRNDWMMFAGRMMKSSRSVRQARPWSVMSRFQYPRPAGRHDFSEYLAEKEAKTHSVRSWPLSCFLYRPNKSACVPVRYKYNSVSVW